MSTSMQATQTAIPRSYHVLMVHLPDVTEQIITINAPDGLVLNGFYVHFQTGEILRPIAFNLIRPTTLYFMASSRPGWYFVAQWYERFHAYGCSCYHGKQSLECTHQLELKKRAAHTVSA